MTTLYIGGPRDADYGNSWGRISSTNCHEFHVSRNQRSFWTRCRVTGIGAIIWRDSEEGRLLEKVIEESGKGAIVECVTKLVMNNASALQLEAAVSSIRLAAYQEGRRGLSREMRDLLEIK